MFNNQKRTNYYFYRRPSDVIRIITYSIIFIWLSILAHTKGVTIIEREIFYLINKIPFEFGILLKLIMYLGTLYGVALIIIITLFLKEKRLSRDIFLAGSITWILNSISKIIIDRARPYNIFLDVIVREITKIPLGFPSGHTAVITAIATIISPYVSKKCRKIIWLIVLLIAVGRIYAGVHFPLDILGGFTLGSMVGITLRLILGSPGYTPSIEFIKNTIAKYGYKVKNIKTLQQDSNSSFTYIVNVKDGKELFIKVSSFEQQNQDWLRKLYNYLIYKNVKGQFPFITNKQKVEHEAYMLLLSKRAGINTPKFLFSGELLDHSWIFAEKKLEGISLNNFEVNKIDDDLLISIWKELKLLHKARIAHKDLRLANIFISNNLEPYIIDFGLAEASAHRDDFSQDIIELMIGLSSLIGVDKAVKSAYKVLGKKDLKYVLPFIQPLAVTTKTRKLLKENPDLLRDIKLHIETITGHKDYKLRPLTRINISMIFTIMVSLFAIHILLPQIGSIENTIKILHTAKYQWILLALFLQSLTYIMSSLSLINTVEYNLSLKKTYFEQLAGLFLSRLTFQGVGGAAMDERYLEKSGIERKKAITALSIIYIINSITKNSLLIISILILRSVIKTQIHLPNEWPYLLGVLLTLISVGIIFIIIKPNFVKQKLIIPGIDLLRNTKSHIKLIFLKQPKRGIRIFIGLLSVVLIDATTLFLCIYAFGDNISIVKVAAVFVGSSMISSLSPTPGGLGAVESSLIIGLTSIGVYTSNAIAGVLVFRLLSFWLPIIPGYISYNYMRIKKII